MVNLLVAILLFSAGCLTTWAIMKMLAVPAPPADLEEEDWEFARQLEKDRDVARAECGVVREENRRLFARLLSIEQIVQAVRNEAE